MVQINFAKREVQCKVVYYGPAESGKTANLRAIHDRSPEKVHGKLTTIATDSNRTLFFDFLPLDLGLVAGIRTKIHIYAIPYIDHQNAVRMLVLEGVDGIVFVADAARDRIDDNRVALENLRENLASLGRDPAEIPLIFQWNKTDLPDAYPAGELDRLLNPEGHPSFAAVAENGTGVFAALKSMTQAVLLGVAHDVKARESRPAKAPAPEPVPEPVAEPAPAPEPVPEAEPSFTPPWRRAPEPKRPVRAPAPDPAPEPAPAPEFEEVELPPEPAPPSPAPSPPPPVEEPPEPAPVAAYAGAADPDVFEHPAPGSQYLPVGGRKPRRMSKPLDLGGWDGPRYGAHGRYPDARPVIERRRRPRRALDLPEQIPTANLVAGAIFALISLIATGYLVYALL